MPDTACAYCGKDAEILTVSEGDKRFHLDCYVLSKRRPPVRDPRQPTGPN